MVPSICFDRNTRRKFSELLRRSGGREVGGILLGEQLAVGKFRLVDFSFDDITGSAAHFCRSVEQHGIEIDRFYEKTGFDFSRYNYLGEWHSHPRFSVRPSTQDCKSMTDLVHSEIGISFAALLIVRLDWFCYLRANAMMFSSQRNPEHIKIVRI